MSAEPKPQACPACGRALPMWSKNYALRARTDGPGVERVVVGRQPAYRKYEPFCTLRCALWYATKMHSRYMHMFRPQRTPTGSNQ